MTKLRTDFTHIIIIGNGFDLNQNLKTSYTDFINSEQYKLLLGKDNYLVEYLSKKHELQNWIDIENELKKYSNSQNIAEANQSFQEEFIKLSSSLKEYLSTISYDNLDKTAYSYKLLESIKDKDFLILDFNYTKAAEIILSELNVEKSIIEERIIKVHGSLDEQNIIFGIEDDARIKTQHVFLRKAFNSKFKAINVNLNLINVKELYIFGHSLGETDHMYFNKFFSEFSMEFNFENGKMITLYHYGQEGYKQLFMQLDKLTNNRLTIFKQNNDFNTIDTSK